MAVLAPMPSASDRIAAAVNPGVFLRRRNAILQILLKFIEPPDPVGLAAFFTQR